MPIHAHCLCHCLQSRFHRIERAFVLHLFLPNALLNRCPPLTDLRENQEVCHSIGRLKIKRKTESSAKISLSTVYPIHLHSAFFLSSADVLTFQPEFAEPIVNISVAVGRDATFTCHVRHLGGYRVSTYIKCNILIIALALNSILFKWNEHENIINKSLCALTPTCRGQATRHSTEEQIELSICNGNRDGTKPTQLSVSKSETLADFSRFSCELNSQFRIWFCA